MERRDFLKYFGVGATIIPVVAGMPKTDAQARLIEVPKVDLEVAQSIPAGPWDMMGKRLQMQATFSDKKGYVYSFSGETFLLYLGNVGAPSPDDGVPPVLRWTLEGVMSKPPTMGIDMRKRGVESSARAR